MKEILFIRHGATPGNQQGRYVGRTDEPLSQLGVQQAQELGRQNLQADQIYTSPAKRTVQTAQLAFPGRAWVEEPRLWEADFGAFEGKTAQELEGDNRYSVWVESGCTLPIPEGESVTSFKQRCRQAFLDCMAQQSEGSCTAFVIHGGCIMAILEALAVPHKGFYDYHIGNAQALRCTMEENVLHILEET